MKSLVVEDHPLYRNALAHLLGSIVGHENLILAGSVPEGLRLASGQPLQLVVLDLGLPDVRGADAVAWMRSAHPGAALIVVSGEGGEDTRRAMMNAGADGYVVKSAPTGELADAIQAALTTERRLNGGKPLPARLTPRQQEILMLMCRGQNNKEIGDGLGLAQPTVKMHVSSVLRALGAVSRTQAVLTARSLGLDRGVQA